MKVLHRGKVAVLIRNTRSLFALLLLAGCGSGGSSGGSGSPSNPSPSANGVASNVSVTDQGNSRFLIGFTLTADTAKTLGVEVDFSEDQGSTFSAATVESQDSSVQPRAGAASFSGTPDGSTFQVVWVASSDLANLQQHDLVIKIVPYNLSSNAQGVPALSDVFGIGSNQAPVTSGLSTPPGTVGGWVTFTYTVSDGEGDHVSISAQYSTNGGSTYADATLGGGDGTTGLSAPASGASHTIRWNAQADVPEAFRNNVRFRLRAADTTSGGYSTSNAFSIRTYAPVIDLLTVNEVPEDMNGSLSFTNKSNQSQSFTLLLPETGFVIGLEFSISSSGAAIDPNGLEMTSSRAIGGGTAGGGYDSGSDFGSLFQIDAANGTAAMTVTSGLAFRAGSHTLTAKLRDVLGNVSASASFTFDTTAASAASRPFESRDVWYLTFTRDNFAITSTTSSSGTVTIAVVQTANGASDFVEDLRILGLNSASPPAAAQAAGLNTVVLELVKENIAGYLNTFYELNFDGTRHADSANLQFSLTQPSGTCSRMAVGGDDPIPGYTIGRAEYDYRNGSANDNTDVDLGVFTTNLIEFYINSSFTFKSKFNALIPGRGTALGFHASDVTVLSDSFDRSGGGNSSQDNNRYDDIMDAVDALARVVATIMAHEIGHSVGLVANGAPSAGLFGGEYNASFAGPYTTDYHLDTPGNNIMAAAISFTSAIATASSAPSFNEMNMAYLLERILVE
ncbi:MAG: hypothetical protein HY717_15715 [Planctomycetes bacterium]|nr:hypothetical protein [Planctomycetota bacterium]